MISRRIFFQHLAGAVAGPVLFDKFALGAEQSKIGLQLYTVRKDMERDLPETLGRVAALGIKKVEFAGYFNNNPAQIKNILKKYGLSAPSAHISLETLRQSLPKAIDDAQAIGHQYLVLAYLPPAARGSLDDYKKLAELLNQAGTECQKAGLQLAYHNHDFEFAEMEGRIPYDLLLAETDPQNIKMEMDLYWIIKAGFDSLTYFEKNPGRFHLVHVKDMDNTPKRMFTEVGRGTIDFKKIFSKAATAGIRHYFVEQDTTPGDPFESVKISLAYLRGLKF